MNVYYYGEHILLPCHHINVFRHTLQLIMIYLHAIFLPHLKNYYLKVKLYSILMKLSVNICSEVSIDNPVEADKVLTEVILAGCDSTCLRRIRMSRACRHVSSRTHSLRPTADNEYRVL